MGLDSRKPGWKTLSPFILRKQLVLFVCFILMKKINVPFVKYERLEYRGE